MSHCLHRGDPFSHPSGSSAFEEANGPGPQFRTERSGPGLCLVPTPSGSVFLVTGLLPLPLPLGQAAVALASRPIPVRSGIQKTFSAGPRSFNTKELWFPGSGCASRVQPVVDSRHGRIAQICPEQTSLLLGRSAAVSNQSVGFDQPLSWLTAALQIHCFCFPAASSGNIRVRS